jgi:TetR/AcrR family transcriptional repressor of nem operon
VVRSKAFDEGAVLTRAMHCFRRHGYAGASIKTLEGATGLTSGSIYNAYRDKDGLFRAALAHYNRAVVARRIATFASEEAGIAGLRRLFLSLLDEPDGCLLTNAAVELGAADTIAKAGVREGFALLREAFARSLAGAREAGAIDRDIDPETTALRLLAFYQGLLVLIRFGDDGAALARLIDREFDQLEGLRHDA